MSGASRDLSKGRRPRNSGSPHRAAVVFFVCPAPPFPACAGSGPFVFTRQLFPCCRAGQPVCRCFMPEGCSARGRTSCAPTVGAVFPPNARVSVVVPTSTDEPMWLTRSFIFLSLAVLLRSSLGTGGPRARNCTRAWAGGKSWIVKRQMRPPKQESCAQAAGSPRHPGSPASSSTWRFQRAALKVL